MRGIGAGQKIHIYIIPEVRKIMERDLRDAIIPSIAHRSRVTLVNSYDATAEENLVGGQPGPLQRGDQADVVGMGEECVSIMAAECGSGPLVDKAIELGSRARFVRIFINSNE